MSYISHFGENPEKYREFRPNYPIALYDYLASLTIKHELAWDCGTGNGQAAVALADYYKKVIATDVSQEQLSAAIKKENVVYECCPCDQSILANHSSDLITIAQALHWFPFESFYTEVRRVAKPGSMIAAWCYSLGKINENIDQVVERLYTEILGDDYWPPERRYIDNAYQTIPFPFEKIVTPKFTMTKSYNFTEFMGYLNTWSAVKEYNKRHQQNPLDLIFFDLKHAWVDVQCQRTMEWPIHLLIGKIA
jgi:ubiquinone/menaquinone biosynthesis C-methylase UbiE